MVALPLAAEAFEEDCRRAVLVVSQRTAPPSCGATLIDRAVWPRTGATALYRAGKSWETVVAFPPGYDRPWARAMPQRTDSETPSSPTRPAQRDATPRVEDLAPED
jgi:competence protein ComEC